MNYKIEFKDGKSIGLYHDDPTNLGKTFGGIGKGDDFLMVIAEDEETYIGVNVGESEYAFLTFDEFEQALINYVKGKRNGEISTATVE